MDAFLSQRTKNPRFQNERRVTPGDEYKKMDDNHKMTPHKGDEGTEKKKKRKKEKGEFSEAKKKKLENRSSSDDSDSGICWSDYERVPGTKAGAKGSCRPKGGGKKD